LLNDLDGVEQDLVQVKEEVLVQRLTPIAGRLDEILEVLKDCKGSVEEISRILIAVRGSIRSKPKWEMVPLSTVVSTALRLIQTEVVHKATLKVECDPHVVVEGDAAELTQVVINLLVNAANAITSGKQSENCVDLVVESKEQMAILHVRDSGCGIPPEIRDKIFEPLFTTRQREGGTGLGLSIIKRIVDNHRGSITGG
jgi:C4-dicarboxylate-specific signal transduction histidine kinase